MAIITTHKFDGDGTQREFQVADTVLSESHARVWVNDVNIPTTEWDLLGSTVLFDVAPTVGSANVIIYVSNDGTFPAEYTSPSNVQLVGESIVDVNTVAESIVDVNIVAEDIANVNKVGTDIANVNTVATNIVNVNKVGADIDNVNKVGENILNVNKVAAIDDAVSDVASEPVRQALLDAQLGTSFKITAYPTVVEGDTVITLTTFLSGASVFINGVLLRLNVDYSIAGKVITLVSPIEVNNGQLDEVTVINGDTQEVVPQSIDHVSLVSTVGLLKTYTVWGDVAEIINLGTFSVSDGIDSDTEQTLTNKTITDISNDVHANLLHMEVQATEAITAGNVLVATGVTDDTVIKVGKRSALTQPIMGLALEDIANGVQGVAVTTGVIVIANNGWSVGDVLYGDASGSLTTVKTVNGVNYNQPVAYVVKANASWVSLVVNVHSGHENASLVGYDNTASGLTAEDVKSALDEIAAAITGPQRTISTVEDNTIDFTVSQDFSITLGASLSVIVGTIPTLATTTPQRGRILVSDTENIAGWTGFTWLGTIPTGMTGVGYFGYEIVGTTVYIVKAENA